MQLDYYKVLFLSTSKDGTAKVCLSFNYKEKKNVLFSNLFQLWDTRTCEPLKTYEVGRPLNAGAISPLMNHLILGGGESAMEVTQTTATSEQFKVR